MPPKKEAPGVNTAPIVNRPAHADIALTRPRTPNDESFEKITEAIKIVQNVDAKWRDRISSVGQRASVLHEKFSTVEFALSKLRNYLEKTDDSFEKLFPLVHVDSKRPPLPPGSPPELGVVERKTLYEIYKGFYLLDLTHEIPRPSTPQEYGTLTPEVLRILQILKKSPEGVTGVTPVASPPVKGKIALSDSIRADAVEDMLLDTSKDLLDLKCPHGLDPSVFHEVLALRSRRVQLQRLFQILEHAVRPVRGRLQCFSSLERLNEYSRNAAEKKLRTSKIEEEQCIAVKEKEDHAWVRAKLKEAAEKREVVDLDPTSGTQKETDLKIPRSPREQKEPK